MREAILDNRWHDIMLWGCAFFACLYVGFGLLDELLIRLMPALGHGGRLDPRPHGRGQLRRELALSAVSVLIFGVGSVVPWGLLQLRWASLAVDPPWWRIALETFALVAWNEVHFYANHWLLHTRALKRFHAPHHHSVVPSPWSTYSFRPLEALMLGNVLLLPMLLHAFSVEAILFLPVFSILFNNVGHSNYDFLPDAERDRWWLNAARRHHLHHACFHGNYGFMFPFMDRACGTALSPDAAKAQIDRHLEHQLEQQAGHAP
ncbi:MAG: sterol desaturase family protein [Planctomycetota bacterium]|nr:sterol desaturase family protein [Planctomycetota bacterium]